MKYIPILYSTPMVQAIDADRKNQTRRLKGLEKINENPDNWDFLKTDKHPSEVLFFEFKNDVVGECKVIKCPYGQPGDVLWVRETFCGIVQSDETVKYHYKADANWALDSALKIFWKPSIHMPKEAARLFLRLKDIRVERLNDISESDAIAEGVIVVRKTIMGTALYKDYRKNYKEPFFCPENSFMSLWVDINGIDSWMGNPWVWVIEFEKIEKPENFI